MMNRRCNEAKHVDKESDDEPPDGGWGWWCVAGCTVMHLLMVGTERLFGMLYSDLIDRFGGHAAAVAGVGGVCSALRLGLAPVSSALSNRLSPRIVVMSGGFIMFTGVILSAFPPSIMFLYFSWGVLVGTGGALVYTPSFIILAMYFKRKLPLANGISTTGSGIGLLIFPPLYALLMEVYTFSWALMIFAALLLNLVNCGALYRPITKRGVSESDAILLLDVAEENAKPENVVDDGKSPTKAASVQKNKRKKLLDFSLLLSLKFIVYVMCMGMFTCAFIPILTFLPAQIIHQGYSRADAAIVLSVLGTTDTVGRLAGGALFSLPFISPRRRVVFVLVLISVSIPTALLPKSHALIEYYVVVGFYGFFMGMQVSLLASIVTDWIGDKDKASALGFLTCARGIGSVLGPVIGGVIKDLTGQYNMTFYVFAAVMLTSSCLYSLLLLYDQVKFRRRNTQ